MNNNIFQHNSNLVLRSTFSLTPDDLVKACGTKKIIVLFSENTDLMSNTYTCKTE